MNFKHFNASACVLLIAICVSFARSQSPDDEPQFEAIHQDIGRITSAASPTVAAASVVRQLPAPPTRPAAPVRQPTRASAPHLHQHASVPSPAPPLENPQPVDQQQQQTPRRKATRRVTLVARPLADAAPAITTPIAPVAELPEAATPTQQPPLLAPIAAPVQVQVAQQWPPQLHSMAPPPPYVEPASGPEPLTQHVQTPRSPATLQFADSPSSSQAAHVFQASPVLNQPAASASVNGLVAVDREQLVEPSLESVVTSGCPSLGVFSWPHKDLCDRYFLCTNGTFTQESCPNGLAYSKLGAVYQHCAYQWNVDCGVKKSPAPLASAGCPWQFGIFALENARCSINYHVCEWGLPEERSCKDGLFYDERIKGCQWADELGCKSENLLQFKCPLNDEDNAYYPFPRYYHSPSDIIVCVSDTPRLVKCNEDQFVDQTSLACLDKHPKKRKLLAAASIPVPAHSVALPITAPHHNQQQQLRNQHQRQFQHQQIAPAFLQ